jgi:hypothetical protein
MPGLVLLDLGAERTLKEKLNNNWVAGSKDLTLKLYTNNLGTLVDTLIASSFVEAVGGGYAAKTITNGSWTIGTAALRQATYAKQTWTFTGALTGPQTIYGYYLVDSDGVAQWAQEFSTPFTPVNNGDPLSITLAFALSKGTPV